MKYCACFDFRSLARLHQKRRNDYLSFQYCPRLRSNLTFLKTARDILSFAVESSWVVLGYHLSASFLLSAIYCVKNVLWTLIQPSTRGEFVNWAFRDPTLGNFSSVSASFYNRE